MPAPAPSKLDAAQVLPAAFDESTGKLRVDAEITANISGAQEVLISSTDDSIRIGNTAGTTAEVKSDGLDNALVVLQSSKNYALRLDDTSTPSITYVGKAVPGTSTASPLWQIRKIDQTSGMIITWAGSSDSFNNVWDDRLTLIYG